jgi:hypothetical protein
MESEIIRALSTSCPSCIFHSVMDRCGLLSRAVFVKVWTEVLSDINKLIACQKRFALALVALS